MLVLENKPKISEKKNVFSPFSSYQQMLGAMANIS